MKLWLIFFPFKILKHEFIFASIPIKKKNMKTKSYILFIQVCMQFNSDWSSWHNNIRVAVLKYVRFIPSSFFISIYYIENLVSNALVSTRGWAKESREVVIFSQCFNWKGGKGHSWTTFPSPHLWFKVARQQSMWMYFSETTTEIWQWWNKKIEG